VRIVAVDVVPYALRFREPYVTARGELERREMALLRLRTDEGIEGLGEAVPLALRGGAPLDAVVAELRGAGAALVGVDVKPDPALADDAPCLSDDLPAPARAALEVARLDLAAKAVGVPLWRLLGAAAPQPVRCNATLAAGPPIAVADAAARWADRGFETFKLKVGMPGDIAQVEAARAALGDGARIRVDANGAWSVQEAVTKLRALEAFGIELAEQPAADLEDLRLVRGETPIPLAADESVESVADARRAVELGACQLATVKLAKVGGIEASRQIAETLLTYLSSALDGPVGIAAAAHLAQVLGPSELAQGLATQLLFTETVATSECELRGDLLVVPEGPGLGVEIDESALERCRV
jgi:L-Ala-D/L-Glu epimerase